MHPSGARAGSGRRSSPGRSPARGVGHRASGSAEPTLAPSGPGMNPTPGELIDLQRTLGNRAAVHVVQRAGEGSAAAGSHQTPGAEPTEIGAEPSFIEVDPEYLESDPEYMDSDSETSVSNSDRIEVDPDYIDAEYELSLEEPPSTQEARDTLIGLLLNQPGKQPFTRAKMKRLERAKIRAAAFTRTGRAFGDLHEDIVNVRLALTERSKKGPMFREEELKAIKACDSWFLKKIKIHSYQEAEQQVEGARNTFDKNARKFTDWIPRGPGWRILVATLYWNDYQERNYERRVKGGEESQQERAARLRNPAYTLARTMYTHSGTDARYIAELKHERDDRIREAFVNTLMPPTRKEQHLGVGDEGAKVARSQAILERVFLILQNGLRVLHEESGTHKPYQRPDVPDAGDVARALGHGGRVVIRIPRLRPGESGHELTDWLGLTRNGAYVDKKGEQRYIGTHRQRIGKDKGEGTEPKFEEKGGFRTGVENAARLTAEAVTGLPVNEMMAFGIDVAADGWQHIDFNAEVIAPDGSHGHLLCVFQPPKAERDGSLQVGLETIGPGKASPVGYSHNMFSTEATANPESSVYGHKVDKIGEGKLAMNQRLVELSTFGTGGDWIGFLDSLQRFWEEMKQAADGDRDEIRRLIERLVGPRRGELTPPAGWSPARAAPAGGGEPAGAG